jgi:hypothetical protein
LIGIVVDSGLILHISWDIMAFLSKLPLSSFLPPSWTTSELFFLSFFLAGGIAVVWAITGNHLSLLFWNFCFLAMHTAYVMFSPPQMLDARAVAIEAAIVFATTAIYLGRKHSQMAVAAV